LPRGGEDIYRRLSVSTSNKPFLQPDEEELLFTGWVKPDRMRISLRSRRPSHFLPLVTGQLDLTRSGCILALRYTLFPTTRLLLQLWSILIILGTLMTAYTYRSAVFVLAGLLLLIIIYLIAWSNFNLQLHTTRKAIHRVVA
jgi:hypothetical protein